MQTFYRLPWTPEKVEYLTTWWPHFGTYHCADELGLSRQQVKSKVNKLRLTILPKQERLCANCRKGFQYDRRGGVKCHTCHLARRKEQRRIKPRSLERWITEATNTARHRSRITSNLTAEYMVNLWHAQGARCYYSGLPLRPPVYGEGRKPFSPSIDRIDPRQGYVRGNVVWASWICNVGKNDLPAEEYVKVCLAVARHQSTRP